MSATPLGLLLQKIQILFINSYDKQSLRELLLFRMDCSLAEEVSEEAGFRTIVFELVNKARREGWLLDLAREARNHRDQKPEWAGAVAELEEALRASDGPPARGDALTADVNRIVLRVLGTNLSYEPPGGWTLLTVGRQRRKPGVLPEHGNDFVIRTADGAETQVISRRHFELHRAGAAISIVDRSKKGTAVNGTRLERDRPHPLQFGDRIEVGGVLSLEIGTRAGWSVAANQSAENVAVGGASVILEVTTGDLLTE